jgi:putative transcription factor
MACELCGKEENLVSTYIEGIKFNVCSNCSKHGRVVSSGQVSSQQKTIVKRQELFEDVVEDYSDLIRNARESKGMTILQVANGLNEKESLISKIEQGHIKPDIKLAKKIENFFGIKLVATEKVNAGLTKEPTRNLTIGDLIKDLK